jgi:D-xylose transport system substrate-binding protein
MSVPVTRLVGLGLAMSALAVSLTACGSNNSGSGSGSAKKIALLLPESKTTRYEALDRPLFTAALKAACANCELIYSNADQDASKQQQQA